MSEGNVAPSRERERRKRFLSEPYTEKKISDIVVQL